MAIKNLQARYPELGRVRLGTKAFKTSQGGKKVSYPVEGEHLRFSSNDDVVLKVLADNLGGEVVTWEGGEEVYQLQTESASVPCLLPPDPLADTPIYERWGKGGVIRRCDGERCTVPELDDAGGHMVEKDCLCLSENMTPGDRADKDACTVTLRIRLVLPFVPGVGVWLCTSHSWYAALELPGQVALIETMRERNRLVPAEFAIEARTEKKPWEKYTRDYIVPVLRVRQSLYQLAAGDAVAMAALGMGEPMPASTSPALPSGRGGDGAGPVETTSSEAIGNGSAKATAGGTTTPPAPSGDESPFIVTIRTWAGRKGLDDDALNAIVTAETGKATLAELEGPAEANAVLAAVRRAGAK